MIRKLFFFLFAVALGAAGGALLYPRLAKNAASAAPTTPAGRKILYYVDPMHPAYKSDKPGIAPDCGMNLEPVYADGGGPAGMAEASAVPGAVHISPEKQQLIGVRFGEVRAVPMARSVRTVGKIAYDETRVARIHAKFEGWVEQIQADFTGKFVKKGEPLLALYSPDLVAAQDEFLLAQKAERYLGDSPVKEVAAGAESLSAASRRKLELWDITGEQIEAIRKRNAPIRSMTVFSPLSGYILSRNVYPRQRITPDTELYSIADLSSVWVIADVYEYEASAVKLGQPVRMTLSYEPGRAYQGKVTYIYPQVDNTTRAIKVRAEFENPDMGLKPDMYANVEFSTNYGTRLAVPQDAVMDSGTETVVFLDRGNGYLEPRKVQLGEKVGDVYEVKNGLKAGDRVVISGNFLVDSESRLKSALSGMGTPVAAPPGTPASREPDTAPRTAPPTGHEGHGGPRP